MQTCTSHFSHLRPFVTIIIRRKSLLTACRVRVGVAGSRAANALMPTNPPKTFIHECQHDTYQAMVPQN